VPARYVKATIGGSSAMVRIDVEAPGNPDFGRNLRTWILQPNESGSGVKELVLPNGTYSASAIAAGTAGAAHGDWLILRAQTKHGVVVADDADLSDVTRVMFVGIDFRERFYARNNGCDRVITWHSKHSNPSGGGLTHNTRPGVFVNGGTNLCFMGSDIHTCTKDGLHMSAQANASMLVQGARVWAIQDPDNEDHNDCLQVRGGIFNIEDSVFGLDPAGNPSGNGHSQIEADIAAINGAYRRCWLTQSGNYSITTGGPNPCNLLVQDSYAWNNPNGLLNGAATTDNFVNGGATPPTGTPPDVAWRQQWPYQSYRDWLLTESGL
jgi:hypothetical protein